MKFLTRTFISWLPLAVAITGICLLIYATVQQNYRQSLNDPQIQIATDAATYLESANSPDVSKVIPTDQYGTPIDFGTSLLPWIAVLNPDGSVYQKKVANGVEYETSGMLVNWLALGGPSYKNPQIPVGVLQAAASNLGKDTDLPFENNVTWQAATNVRQAIVVVAIPKGMGPYQGDFVVTGRNMGEVENREARLSQVVFLAWLVLMVATFTAALFVAYARSRI